MAAHHPITLIPSDTGCADKGPVEGERIRAPPEELLAGEKDETGRPRI